MFALFSRSRRDTVQPGSEFEPRRIGMVRTTARVLTVADDLYGIPHVTFELTLAPVGSEFQRSVWDQLVLIGYGETASYGEIARRLGKSNAASRAVGLANGSNPIPIVIPCHRVIGANGTLTGYAGGIERKQTLLELEQDALF